MFQSYFFTFFFLFAFEFGARADDREILFPAQNPRQVYLAGPLFNEHERLEMEKIARILEEAGFKTFLPHRDGFLLASIQPYIERRLNYPANSASSWTTQAVDALDVYQVIVRNGSMVVNLNGRVPDEGAVAEASMAWVLGKPIVAYRDDVRSLTKNIQNPLVSGRSDFSEVSDMADLATTLQTKIDHLRTSPPLGFSPPKNVVAKIRQGEVLWGLLQRARDAGSAPQLETEATARMIVKLFGGASECGDDLANAGNID